MARLLFTDCPERLFIIKIYDVHMILGSIYNFKIKVPLLDNKPIDKDSDRCVLPVSTETHPLTITFGRVNFVRFVLIYNLQPLRSISIWIQYLI